MATNAEPSRREPHMETDTDLQARSDVQLERIARLEGQNLALRAILSVVVSTHHDKENVALLLGPVQQKAEALVVPDDVYAEAKLDGVRDGFRMAALPS